MREVQNLFKKAAAMVTVAVCQVPTEMILSTVQYSDDEDERKEEYSSSENGQYKDELNNSILESDRRMYETKSHEHYTYDSNSSLSHGSSFIDEAWRSPSSTVRLI
mmetsp:Transcript_5394/g.6226  ORF Transcript_5394/g.6226 Transcript_5394/m.6226 type:complete len:106 (+) Transcript_5394:135-452(+)